MWTVPATRMKAKREHRVPLCGRAPEILDETGRLGGEDSGRLVFTRLNGRPLFEKRLRRTGSGRRAGTGPPRKRSIPGRWSRRRWRMWSRTRWKLRTGVPTCSSGGGGS